jgi:hypothetical protein
VLTVLRDVSGAEDFEARQNQVKATNHPVGADYISTK